MLVYGDQQELAEPAQRARGINRTIDGGERMRAGLERHSRLVSTLIEAGRLLQGVADATFAENRCDRRTDAGEEIGAVVLNLGRAVCRSWDSGFRAIGELPRLRIGHDWPREVGLRVPEGFAFYAVYPEAYVDAARRLKLSASARVIGIRSIGTSLAAVVAA